MATWLDAWTARRAFEEEKHVAQVTASEQVHAHTLHSPVLPLRLRTLAGAAGRLWLKASEGKEHASNKKERCFSVSFSLDSLPFLLAS